MVGVRGTAASFVRFQAVGRDTEMVIDGFWGAGNTFALAAFLSSQTVVPSVAHHLHCPSQFKEAVRLGIPALLVVRHPDDAIVSSLLRGEINARPRQAFEAYIRFHEEVLPLLSGLVVSDFSETTTDFGRVIQRVNERFGTHYMPFIHSQENVDRCFEMIDERYRHGRRKGRELHKRVARPSEARRQAPTDLPTLRAPGFQSVRAAARRIYEEILRSSSAP